MVTEDNPFHIDKKPEHCPECNGLLHIKSGKSGAFWGCESYPECHYTRPLSNQTDVHFVKILDDVCCPECEGDLAVKTGKYGMFIGCMNYPDCHFVVKDNDDDDYNPVVCPECQKGKLHMRANKKGHNFYACDQYPKCHYLVNHRPVDRSCTKCGFAIVEDHQERWVCPDCHNAEAK